MDFCQSSLFCQGNVDYSGSHEEAAILMARHPPQSVPLSGRLLYACVRTLIMFSDHDTLGRCCKDCQIHVSHQPFRSSMRPLLVMQRTALQFPTRCNNFRKFIFITLIITSRTNISTCLISDSEISPPGHLPNLLININFSRFFDFRPW